MFRRAAILLAIGILVVSTACKGRTVSVSSGTLDSVAIRDFKTFTVKAPAPTQDTVALATTNGRDRASAMVMNMDPMLSTSIVGQAMRQQLTEAFSRRGYRVVDSTPDFYVAYYAGTGHIVDTRASQRSYRTTGLKTTTQTFQYPAGTIVVDVIDARTDSLVWRGTGLAKIPNNPDDYARAARFAIDRIVSHFPEASR